MLVRCGVHVIYYIYIPVLQFSKTRNGLLLMHLYLVFYLSKLLHSLLKGPRGSLKTLGAYNVWKQWVRTALTVKPASLIFEHRTSIGGNLHKSKKLTTHSLRSLDIPINVLTVSQQVWMFSCEPTRGCWYRILKIEGQRTGVSAVLVYQN